MNFLLTLTLLFLQQTVAAEGVCNICTHEGHTTSCTLVNCEQAKNAGQTPSSLRKVSRPLGGVNVSCIDESHGYIHIHELVNLDQNGRCVRAEFGTPAIGMVQWTNGRDMLAFSTGHDVYVDLGR